MGNLYNDALTLIEETKLFLKEIEGPLLVSAEEADYFRKLYKNSARVEKPEKINGETQGRQGAENEKKHTPETGDIKFTTPSQGSLEARIHKKDPENLFYEKREAAEAGAATASHKKHLNSNGSGVVTQPAPEKINGSAQGRQDAESAEKKNVHASVSKELIELVKRLSPELAILGEIPTDVMARKINTRWKTKSLSAPITIISYQENGEQKALLEQIGRAIDVVFGPAKVIDAEAIEKEKQWEALLSAPELKWIVCCDYSLWQLGGLMKFYHEVPATQSRKLKDVPLFLLPDLSLYLKDPQLKRSLWKGLCQTFLT